MLLRKVEYNHYEQLICHASWSWMYRYLCKLVSMNTGVLRNFYKFVNEYIEMYVYVFLLHTQCKIYAST